MLHLNRHTGFGAGNIGAASLVGESAANALGTPYTITLPAGTQVGDLCFIISAFGSAGPLIGTNTNTWTSDTQGGITVWRSFLTDIVGTIQFTSGGNCGHSVVVFRNIQAAALIGKTSSTTVSGFTKNGFCRGIATFGQINDPTAPVFGTPVGVFTTGTAGDGASQACRAAYNLTPALYVNGTDIVWGPGTDQAFVYELT